MSTAPPMTTTAPRESRTPILFILAPCHKLGDRTSVLREPKQLFSHTRPRPHPQAQAQPHPQPQPQPQAQAQSQPSLSPQERWNLLRSGNSTDRAFLDAIIRIEWAQTRDLGKRAQLNELHGALRAASLEGHFAIRQEIRAGRLRLHPLRAQFDKLPLEERDHFVEEVLGIAYPPLEEEDAEPEPEVRAYTPSGYDEMSYAFDVMALGPENRLFDVGSGAGKAILLASLVCGARCSGLEKNPSLHDLAARSAKELNIESHARSVLGDLKTEAIAMADEADVVFMYLPFTGATLTSVMDRLLSKPRHFLCGGAADQKRYPQLELVAPAKSWLHIYKIRETR
jgi:hypothetical protein